MSKKENANQKLSKWMNHTYIETEEKKPFFKGYRPPYYFRNTEENIDMDILSRASLVRMDDYAKNLSKLEDMRIDVGTILLVDKDGINEEYQVLDNSEINPEYPFALLDIKRHRLVQTSASLDYMNYGHYIFIDKEYKIINIR